MEKATLSRLATLLEKNVTLSAKLFFSKRKKNKKKVYKPVWLLGFRQITVTYQMLHYCNPSCHLFIDIAPRRGAVA